MTAAVIFVIAILTLGGVIAVVSDRLGTKVGKARLSLFKMRPKKTAAVVTMATGTMLSALTLVILFATSKPLRRGVFTIDQIQDRLNQARRDLTHAQVEKHRVESELIEAQNELQAAVDYLNEINSSLNNAKVEVSEREQELKRAQSRLQNTESELHQLQNQLSQMEAAKTEIEEELDSIEDKLSQVSQQKQDLETEIDQLQVERQDLIKQRETVSAQIEERDRQIADQDMVIAEREERLAELEIAQQQLEQQKANAQRGFQMLREGSVALKRGEILASGLVRISDKNSSIETVNRLLQEANRKALKFVQMGNQSANQDMVVMITKAEVEELIEEINNGGEYVVQIIAAANYLVGEKRVAVYTMAEPNRLLFSSGEVVAGTSLNPATMSSERLQQQLEQLLDASSFRARFVGVVNGSIEMSDDRIDTLIYFIQQLEGYNQTLELQAVAAEDIYTIGPLRLDLFARHNGEVLISTRQPTRKLDDIDWAEVWRW
ncbi:MAG: DUF3084 domain-containing protein [Limnospira sp. PMC 1291.21]|uniref:DUF3084 domain-containing protein n=1 Tax=unclassified Limnospira TaxID=2642885 RepID=UPI0028E0EF44|nr:MULTISPECIES: DUF3084 domain-containing protein [unclassified Limnospira]MDT9180320.1 DUF3084 domain-containing protein [Limnospira sp. PMC 1238.20]MDT9195644.1 DUF3084 domain-containing protein [Limnospira sp. PMC 1245.20]MDT9205849.1 DUF3084 domain-containing protein [Limnospira sp. PMC 1243.20]MDT9211013.1 DUF3084 domain-containing protein [Limnospira sp. PMC 1252.20]MDT9216086.1 DUF3084 domain-containing protein [Limnospira sp. PMC 1256.20]